MDTETTLDETGLDERKSAILRAVIEEYTDTAQPVGSSAVAAAANLKVSAATIRNEMVALENAGYLRQPHTSAGRVPTQKGYRHFVDGIDAARLPINERRKVSSFFAQMRGEIEEVMRDTAALLANLTDHAAVVVDETDDAAIVRSVQLVSLAERTVMLVVVLSNGQILKHSLDFDTEIGHQALERATGLLRESLESRPLAAEVTLARSGDPTVDGLAEQFHRELLVDAAEAERVYVDGASKVAGAFEAVDSVGQVLTILEQQLVVVSLLADVMERGLTVAIGTETGVEPLSECSLVVSPYEIDGERAGSIAVLGPTRMNYPQAMSAVAVVSSQLGNRLSEG
ncbi:MAG: heat-inducible transcriptional repressor HrcA [Actinomycetota bacterium]